MNLIAPTLIICDAQQFIGTQSPRRGMSVGCLFAGKRTRCQHGEAMGFVLGLSIDARHLMHSQKVPKVDNMLTNVLYIIRVHVYTTAQAGEKFPHILLSHPCKPRGKKRVRSMQWTNPHQCTCACTASRTCQHLQLTAGRNCSIQFFEPEHGA